MSHKSLHHSFDTNVALEYGIEEAIIIHHFQHWITLNVTLKRNFHEGRYWTYQSLEEIAAHFPYWSKDDVFNILERLCTGKSRFSKKETKLYDPVLIKGNFNKSKYDRTIWYAFCDSTKWILCNHKMEIAIPRNGDCDSTTPIPHTIPDNKTDIEQPLTPSKGEVCVWKEFLPFVKLKEEEYTKLVSEHSQSVITDIITEVNDYLASTGKKPYKDFAAAIRQWLRRRQNAAKPLNNFFYKSHEIDRRQRNPDGTPSDNPLAGVF